MPANDTQVGGTHYSVLPYQHWDWAADAGLTYLQGQATKYLARYPQTRSLEDLRKAAHYCEKLQEQQHRRTIASHNFTSQSPFELDDGLLARSILSVATSDLRRAEQQIELLIARHSAAPVPLTEETHHGERPAEESPAFYCEQFALGKADPCETQCNHCHQEDHRAQAV